ncbi:MAG: AIR carboxylase family protein, partial [candidate division Zixibacteria bacterium]|nr:AIR carboxylase family protein [candidate division Zixibacteria bacterium]
KIECDIEVASAHRHPEKTAELTGKAQENGYEVIIAMAGLAAALPGTAAAHSLLPVIGVPLPAALGGIDSLLSIAQMPPGIPVGTVGVGSPGAKNAAILAGRILSLHHTDIREALEKHRKSL